MKKLFIDMSRVNDGVCPFCGKGPIMITIEDISKFLIDESGMPIMSFTSNISSHGICSHCGKYIGEYVRDLFNYRRPAHKKPQIHDITIYPKEDNPFMR